MSEQKSKRVKTTSASSGTTGKVVHWGVLSTARIAVKNVRALHDARNAEVVAVASRNLAKAASFAKEHGIPKAYGSYDELLNDTSIDAVYIPIPTVQRTEWAIKAAQKGKHILCEKPVAVDAQTFQTILDACKTNNVHYMDGTMFVHNSRLNLLRTELDKTEEFGDLKRITSDFSFFGNSDFVDNNIRVNKMTEPLGSLGDLGWYNIRLSLWAMRYQLPTHVRAEFHAQHDGVPTDVSATLYFANGTISQFHASFATCRAQWADIAGTNGAITINDFVIAGKPNDFLVRPGNCQFGQETPRTVAIPETRQDVLMWEHCSDTVASWATLSAQERQRAAQWGTESKLTQTVVDACMRAAASGKKEPVEA